MSQASQQVSRYRPAVIAVTGVAAAVGIWTLYSSFADRTSKSPLHRSNAVRRSRRPSAIESIVEASAPSFEEPLGAAVIKWNDIVVGRIVFGRDKVPSSAEWRSSYGEHTEHARAAAASVALQSILFQCQRQLNPALEQGDDLDYLRQVMAAYGLTGLAESIQANPRGAAEEFRTQILEIIGDGDLVDLERAFHDFPNGAELPYLPISDAPPVRAPETEVDVQIGGQAEPEQRLKGLLYFIAENKAMNDAYEHRGIQCDGCGEFPIRGVRWHCLNCPDVDFCSTCEASSKHQQTHVFVKIKIPLPFLSQKGRTLAYPVWYPGNPHRIHEPISPELRKQLAEKHEYEESQIDALYDQFVASANVSIHEDYSAVKVGIDRRAFDSALTSKAWTEHSSPNVLYDRMFLFYDRDDKGVIAFEDFVDGLSYLRGPRRLQPLSRALEGFDVDSDGFIDRADFLSLLRAKYEVQKELIASSASIRAEKAAQENMGMIKSSQPISGMFNEQDMPRGAIRPVGGKVVGANGDLEPQAATKTLLEDSEVPSETGSLPNNVIRVRSLQQLQRRLEHLDRALQSPTIDSEGEAGPSTNGQATSGSSTTSLTAEEAEVLGVKKDTSSGRETASGRQDALWHYTEISYNELLASIFEKREQLDRRVSETASERSRWRKEIDDFVARKKELEENLRTGAELDPLVAAAAHSYDRTSKAWMNHQQENEKQLRDAEVRQEIDVQMRDNIQPTDTPSLDKLESDIQEQSLEDLLAAAGYSVDDGAEKASSSAAGPSQTSPQESNSSTSGSAPVDCDTTLPQNRPNTASASCQSDNAGPSKQNGAPIEREQLPSQERLEELVSLDEAQKAMEERGGAGRVSYQEIEAVAKRKEDVRGLILSWLELASF
ncbi:hypothetical protein WHR41_03201 [Cladosporium halotolerans]|uniref:Uncharacterized protein n=1 Tax=Cladosporium halotolerans TaxID=1052096 RepID=A0AB34KTH7_9PEZI